MRQCFACSASASRPRSRRSSVRPSAAVAAALGCVPRGQWALLDADILAVADKSACLVEPVLVGGAVVLLPVLVHPRTRRVRSLLANILIEKSC